MLRFLRAGAAAPRRVPLGPGGGAGLPPLPWPRRPLTPPAIRSPGRSPAVGPFQRRAFSASFRIRPPSPLAASLVLGGGAAASAFVYVTCLDDVLSVMGFRRIRRRPPVRGGAPLISDTSKPPRRSRRSVRIRASPNADGGGWWSRVRRAVRILVRAAHLLLTLGPVAALYPAGRLLGRGDGGEGEGEGERSSSAGGGLPDWYLRLCLRCAERSGAAVVKLLQWASSRPDLFGEPFCAVFEALQDRTTPHGRSHTERALRDAYGEGWDDRIELGEVIGSGCIGQVYKGRVKTGDGQEQDVAIKVMHPNVRSGIDADLDILRLAASLAERLPYDIGSQLKWLDLPGTVEEFASLLTLQLDFRTEAENLRRFNKNFADDDAVMFPQLVQGYDAQPDILVETFCEGMPVISFLRENGDSSELRTKLCRTGIRTVCKMIFDHNFIHGDLHPGNVLVCPQTNKFILLDVGMVTEYDDADHEIIVSVLTSFIRMDGRRAGALMISDSMSRMQGASDGGGVESAVLREEAYIDKIEALTIRAQGSDFLMENLGTYVSYICNAASTHHVMMNPAFVSAALAVKVQEGIAIALDPSVEIWRIANPIILQSEFRRKINMLRDWLFAGVIGLTPKNEDWEHAQDLVSLGGLEL